VDHEELLGEIEEGEEQRLERELFGESEEESEGQRERARLAKEQEEKREREEEERARRILAEARRERAGASEEAAGAGRHSCQEGKAGGESGGGRAAPPEGKSRRRCLFKRARCRRTRRHPCLSSRKAGGSWRHGRRRSRHASWRRNGCTSGANGVHRRRRRRQEAAKRKLDAEQSRQLAEERKAQLSPKGKGRKAVVSPPKQPQREHIPPRDSPEFVRYVERKVDALVAAVQAAPGIGWEAGDPLPPNAHEVRRILRDLLGAVNRFPDCRAHVGEQAEERDDSRIALYAADSAEHAGCSPGDHAQGEQKH
jgi:hypothetical protein